MRPVYLDHNATTPIRPEVRARWIEAQDELAGNPSSVHGGGRRARLALDRAREQVAAALAVDEEEIVFTSGGTEANNIAVQGTLAAAGDRAALVTTTIEHSSVLDVAKALERAGRPVVYAEASSEGFVDPDAIVERAVATRAALVSTMAANNEIGTCQPLAAIARALRASGGGLLHADAVQMLGRVPLNLQATGVDLASFSAHKVGGPVGVGVLFRRRGVAIAPLMHGGGQESGLRPGTENVAAIVAAALAIELAVAELDRHARWMRELATSLWRELRAAVPTIELVGPPFDDPRRLPGTLNVLAPHVDGKVLVTQLDLEGLQASAGSACASGSIEPSHVLLALGYDAERARAALRLSLGRTSTLDDVHIAVDILRRTLGERGAGE